jgi:hypothetical protein
MHPPAIKLDAIAAGDADAQAALHLETCEACRAYVDALRAGAEGFRAKKSASEFAAAVQRRSESRAPAKVLWLFAPAVVAAAAVVLWLRAPLRGGEVGRLPSPAPTAEGAARFKGETSVAVVRERDGHQERIVGPFGVRAGDRIRVEVAVDREGPITAGLLSDDATWIPLLAPAALEAGTHYSELAAHFDDTETRATLLVGTPDAVQRARETKRFDGVIAWRVTSDVSR